MSRRRLPNIRLNRTINNFTHKVIIIMNPTVLEVAIGGRQHIFDSGKIARFADGSVLYRVGKNVLLATVVSEKHKVDENFLPLTVQYIEKSYAAGRFPSGFMKREGKPSDFEVLTSRLVDRSIRPLLPKGYNYPTQVTVTTLSCDHEADLQALALGAASAALYISDLPVEKAAWGVRVGKIDGKLIANPTMSELENSSLDLFVSGTQDEILMIEMRSRGTYTQTPSSVGSMMPFVEINLDSDALKEYATNEMAEEELLEAIRFAASSVAEASSSMSQKLSAIKKPTRSFELKTLMADDSLALFIRENFTQKMQAAILEMSKSERSDAIERVTAEIAQSEFAVNAGFAPEVIAYTAESVKRSVLRNLILNESKRPDGRGLREVRPISIETNILPCAHGSCLFTRGQTQALAVATIGSEMDKQGYQNLTDGVSKSENFSLHYNFPGYSVGEASRVGAPGRRELGHGNLAKRAIESLINPEYDSAIRVVSEILESNGSSSMATVCAASLALKAAGIPLIDLAGGVAMGLIKEGDSYAIITDIIGLEDYDGDMDFKVAGTTNGVTALQMDIKLGGVNFELLKDALLQAKEGREHILSLMQKAAQEIQLNTDALPSTEIFHIDASRIVDIIGQAGKTIKEIIERFEVAIDLDREKGKVKLSGKSATKVQNAKEHIIGIASQPSSRPGRDKDRGAGRESKTATAPASFEPGAILKGTVKRIVDFGAFIELPGGHEGLLHISKIAQSRVNSVKDHLSEGQEVEVKVLECKGGRVELSLVF